MLSSRCERGGKPSRDRSASAVPLDSGLLHHLEARVRPRRETSAEMASATIMRSARYRLTVRETREHVEPGDRVVAHVPERTLRLFIFRSRPRHEPRFFNRDDGADLAPADAMQVTVGTELSTREVSARCRLAHLVAPPGAPASRLACPARLDPSFSCFDCGQARRAGERRRIGV